MKEENSPRQYALKCFYTFQRFFVFIFSVPCDLSQGIFIFEVRLMNGTEYMRLAISLAKKGEGSTNPNPMVGAVIVKDGRIIGQGYHKKCGELHAERNAFASLTEPAQGAVLYVTLEPCCHYGRTPPCTDAIIEHGISKVVIGSSDPNPLVAGKGADQLRSRGIEVVEGFLKEECDALNTIFFHYITTGLPYTAVKFAMTLDGKIATGSGLSKWITGEASRRHIHHLRNKYAAIMVGIGTVLADDPLLNCRIEGGSNPLRVICDSRLRIPDGSQICRTARNIPTLIAYSDAPDSRVSQLEAMGITLLHLPDGRGRTDLAGLLRELGKMKIDSILVEGGGNMHDSIMAGGLADHVYAYIAPKIFGGANAKSPVEGSGVQAPDCCAKLTNLKTTLLGEDILLEYDTVGGYADVYRNS